MASRNKVAVVVGMLCEAFSRKPTAATIEGYMVVLGDLTDSQLDMAGSAALHSTASFMPTPGQLRALAVTGGRGVESQCEAAWSALNHALSRYGIGRSVNFRDGLINATVRQLGGWERIGTLTDNDFNVWYRKEFFATYGRFMQSGCPAQLARYLVGEMERSNAIWVGVDVPLRPLPNREAKPYEHAVPVDVASDYATLLESPPAAKQIERRSNVVPRLELKRVAASRDK